MFAPYLCSSKAFISRYLFHRFPIPVFCITYLVSYSLGYLLCSLLNRIPAACTLLARYILTD